MEYFAQNFGRKSAVSGDQRANLTTSSPKNMSVEQSSGFHIFQALIWNRKYLISDFSEY